MMAMTTSSSIRVNPRRLEPIMMDPFRWERSGSRPVDPGAPSRANDGSRNGDGSRVDPPGQLGSQPWRSPGPPAVEDRTAPGWNGRGRSGIPRVGRGPPPCRRRTRAAPPAGRPLRCGPGPADAAGGPGWPGGTRPPGRSTYIPGPEARSRSAGVGSLPAPAATGSGDDPPRSADPGRWRAVGDRTRRLTIGARLLDGAAPPAGMRPTPWARPLTQDRRDPLMRRSDDRAKPTKSKNIQIRQQVLRHGHECPGRRIARSDEAGGDPPPADPPAIKITPG